MSSIINYPNNVYPNTKIMCILLPQWREYLAPDYNGNGGSIVDSGTTFTYMNLDVFEPVLSAFVNQVKCISRTENIEKLTGLRPCFNISSHKTVSLSELKFHFKGGSEMALPLANYFSIAGK
ncbi:hypothetical protein A4A49_55204 [Nicotiana attenuata]|uniref:Peptidase A1 domain-containing protein n=1 Tax=Nicotiana attenuata TaxID=49451 RepID=A0A314KZK3_NICAT|nr:hypothetical protein A4A49_55204 [Nicotiana attenuata]